MGDGELVTIEVDTGMYPLAAIQRAAHRFTGTHFVELTRAEQTTVVHLTARGALRFPQLREEFQNALLDEHLRGQINDEVGPVREMLVKAALQGAVPKIRKPSGDTE